MRHFDSDSGMAQSIQNSENACVPAAHLQESRGPPDRKPRKSLKNVFPALLAQSLEKAPKRSTSPQKVSKKCHFGDFSTFSVFFLSLWARWARKILFETSFVVFGPEGLETLVDLMGGRDARKRILAEAVSIGCRGLVAAPRYTSPQAHMHQHSGVW